MTLVIPFDYSLLLITKISVPTKLEFPCEFTFLYISNYYNSKSKIIRDEFRYKELY